MQVDQIVTIVLSVGGVVAGLLRMWVAPIQKDIKFLAQALEPIDRRVNELSKGVESMRIEQAQHAVRMEARQAQEESLRTQIQTLSGEIRDLAERMREVEYSQAHQGNK